MRELSDREGGRRFGDPPVSVSGIAISLVAEAPAVRGATMLQSRLAGVTAGPGPPRTLTWNGRAGRHRTSPARPAGHESVLPEVSRIPGG